MGTLWVDNDEDLNVGSVAFIRQVSPQGRADRMVVSLRPCKTNRSHEARLHGWCGETNNVSIYAKGVGRVLKVNKTGERVMVSILNDEELDNALDELGYPDIAR